MKYILSNLVRFTYDECVLIGEWIGENKIPVESDDENHCIIMDISEEDLIIFKIKFGA